MLILFAMSVTNLNAGIIWSGPETEEIADRLETDNNQRILTTPHMKRK